MLGAVAGGLCGGEGGGLLSVVVEGREEGKEGWRKEGVNESSGGGREEGTDGVCVYILLTLKDCVRMVERLVCALVGYGVCVVVCDMSDEGLCVQDRLRRATAKTLKANR